MTEGMQASARTQRASALPRAAAPEEGSSFWVAFSDISKEGK